MDYQKGKGYLVGVFNEVDLKNGKDKIETDKLKEKTGMKYTNTSLVSKKGNIVGIKVWVCTLDDMKLF